MKGWRFKIMVLGCSLKAVSQGKTHFWDLCIRMDLLIAILVLDPKWLALKASSAFVS